MGDMQSLPHKYSVSSQGAADGALTTQGQHLPPLLVDGPAEFGGPGDQWSPETLLTAALANCFILSFRAIAQASRFEWQSIRCQVEGELDKVERSLKFTRFHQQVTLYIQDESQRDKAAKLLEKAETSCLVSNTLAADISLDYDIICS